MAIQITDDMFAQMLDAAANVLKDKWVLVKEYASNEFKKLSLDLTLISTLYAAGKLSEEQAKLHFQMQKLSARAILLAIEGIGLIAIEMAINAALAVVSASVNTALGFTLL